MEFVLNMFVLLCVGMSYAIGYALAILALILLVTWIIDYKYETNWSNNILDFIKLFCLKKDAKVICQKCEDTNDMDFAEIEDNYCSLCGKEFKKHKTSAYDIKVEKMTNKILLFALAGILFYNISTTLLIVFIILSIIYYYFNVVRSTEPKNELS